MQCPKCAADQPDGREECVSCGIIFSRWRSAEQRRAEPPAPPRVEIAPPPANEGVPSWMVIAGVVVFAIFGIIWTAKRHAARASSDPAAELTQQLDNINQSGIERRKQIATERENALRAARADEARQAAPVMNNSAAVVPSDLDLNAVRNQLQRCSFLSDEITEALPKSFDEGFYGLMVERYPIFEAAERDQLIAFVPPLQTPVSTWSRSATGRVINVVFTASGGKLLPTARGNEYLTNLGHRLFNHFGTVNVLSERFVRVPFTWSYQIPLASSLLATVPASGYADVVRNGSGAWTLTGAHVDEPGGSSKNVCK